MFLEGKKHLRVTLDMLTSYDESAKSDIAPIQTGLCMTQLPQLGFNFLNSESPSKGAQS